MTIGQATPLADVLEDARDDAIREASSAGATLEQIGKAAGLSRQRVHQIVHAKT